MIPPDGNADFVAAMEQVLDVYQRPYDAIVPVICMDETPRQLIRSTRIPIPAGPGRPERHDTNTNAAGPAMYLWQPDLWPDLINVVNAPIETLTDHHAEFDLGHIEPTAVFRRIDEVKTYDPDAFAKQQPKVTERRTKLDWAQFLDDIAVRYTDGEKITLAMDNLNTDDARTKLTRLYPTLDL